MRKDVVADSVEDIHPGDEPGRQVGDVAEEDFVAKRVKANNAKPEAQPEAKADTNSPPAKP